MSKKKYVYANVKVPIELVDGYDYNLCAEYMTVDFEPCEELPEIQSNENADLFHKLFSMHKPSEVQEEVMRVFAADLEHKTPKQRKNRSFRIKRHKTRDYTRRKYDVSEKDEDEDACEVDNILPIEETTETKEYTSDIQSIDE
jgi:hypothetical protein